MINRIAIYREGVPPIELSFDPSIPVKVDIHTDQTITTVQDSDDNLGQIIDCFSIQENLESDIFIEESFLYSDQNETYYDSEESI